MEASQCQSTFVRVNNIPTKVCVFNPTIRLNAIEDDVVFDAPKLILMVSGNPGEIDYYQHFLAYIHHKSKLPVIGISNSGHNRLPRPLTMPDVNANVDLYNLEGQTCNKAAFIEKYITERTKLIMIGHSIGCYMILELLDKHANIRSMVVHSILVFPTIDSMVVTKSGRSINRLFTYFYYPLLWLSYALETLAPESMKLWLVSRVMQKFQNVPEIVLRSATNLFSPNQLKALICMTLSEFERVKEPNLTAIRNNQDCLSILYGEADPWCPVEYFERMTKHFDPKQLDIRCCLGQIDHAFVSSMQDTRFIAKLVLQIIEKSK